MVFMYTRTYRGMQMCVCVLQESTNMCVSVFFKVENNLDLIIFIDLKTGYSFDPNIFAFFYLILWNFTHTQLSMGLFFRKKAIWYINNFQIANFYPTRSTTKKLIAHHGYSNLFLFYWYEHDDEVNWIYKLCVF